MSKTVDMARVSAKGSFNLLWGLVISTLISAVGSVFIARLLGSDLYGLYGIVLTAPNLIIIFRDWGINSAMVRFTAQFRAEGRIDEIRSIYSSGLIFEIAAGLILSIISFLLSDFMATSVFNRPQIAPLIKIASFSILASGLITAAASAFIGYEKMGLNNVMIISQSIIKTALVIVLVILGLGTSGATIGFTIGTVVAGLIGVILIWTIYRTLPTPFTHKLELRAYLSAMLHYCLPLSLAVILAGFLAQFYAFLLPIHYAVDNIQIGNYGVAQNFVILITFFATPITTMLFPAFSKLNPQKDKETLRNAFQFSVKYATLLVVPVTALVMCLSEPAVSTLFGNTYDTAPLYLALLAITYLYTAFGNLSIVNLLNSQGQTKYVLKMTVLTAAIGFPFGYVMILTYGVIGLIVTSLIDVIPSLIILLRFIRKHYDLTVDWASSAKILLSSAITAITTYFVVTALPFASWIRLIFGVILFLIILIPAMVLTKAVTRTDIHYLADMVSAFGPIGKLLTLFLGVVEKLIVALKQ